MNSNRIVMTALLAGMLTSAASVQAQLVVAPSTPALQASPPPILKDLPPATRVHASSEGLPPADPKAADIWRADPKLRVGVDLNANLGIEGTLTNPGYREGLHLVGGSGPRTAESIALGVGGISSKLVGRLTVPVDERLSAFGTLGVAADVRERHDGRTVDVGPASSVGATYKLNSKQTATAEIPLGAAARKAISGSSSGFGANLKLGF